MTTKRLSTIPCPLCKNTSFFVLFPSTLTDDDYSLNRIRDNLTNSLDDYTKHAQIVRCTSCSVVYTNPREKTSALLQGYEDVEDAEYIKTEKYRKILLSEHLAKLENYKMEGTILDIGCFAGFFLELAKNHKWKIYGIEPSIWASQIAKKKGTILLGKAIETTKLPNNFFDVVTLWDVLEHLPDPNSLLKQIKKCLKKDGIIAIGTPNIESIFARLLGSHCPFLIRMHLVLYSPKTLRILLEKHGFSIISVSSYGRIFPLSYILTKIRLNRFIDNALRKLASIPFLENLPIRLNFYDSSVIIAKKKN